MSPQVLEKVTLLTAVPGSQSDDTATNPPGNGPNGLYRRSEFTYNRLGEATAFKDPAGTVHTYSFDQHGRLLDDAVTTLAEGFDARLGRLSSLGYADSTAYAAELQFTYAGVAMPVKMVYPNPGLQWTVLHQSGDTANPDREPYAGLDRFGRLFQARWLNTAGTETRVHVKYWYDTASRRTKRLAPNAPTGNKEAEAYTYDGLSQVTGRQRGTPQFASDVFTGIASPPEREELFKYDVLGNWQRYTVLEPHVEDNLPWPEDATPPTAQTILFDQNRSHNEANQITGFSNTDHYLAHDPAGNLTASAPTPDNDWSNGMSYWPAPKL